MEYIFALATMFVVFVIPSVIVIGLVGAPDKSRRRSAVRQSAAEPAESQH
jgi:hypothetical protein